MLRGEGCFSPAVADITPVMFADWGKPARRAAANTTGVMSPAVP
jgi:hypothetical protein